MTHFRINRDYRSTVNGRTFGPWRAGDAAEIDPSDLVWLLCDSPGLIDLRAPLTAEQVAAAAVQRAETDRQAIELGNARETAVRAHRRRHNGDWCYLNAGIEPAHIDELIAVPDGQGWRVGCARCQHRLAAVA